MRILAYGSGYILTPWHSDAEEIRYTVDPKCGGKQVEDKAEWAPSSKDFAAIATASGSGAPAKSVDELLALISKQGVESIEELRILGHANESGLSLAGIIKPNNVYFDGFESAWFEPDSIFSSAAPKFQALQDRFTDSAQVTLMGCHSGGGAGTKKLLELISRVFLRKAAGFQHSIDVQFRWGPQGAAVKNPQGQVICRRLAANSRITTRGLMMYASTAQQSLLDEMSVISGSPTSGGLFQQSVWQITPDVFNDDFDIFRLIRGKKDLSVAAQSFMWLLMKVFHEKHVWVSGSAFDKDVPGLRVRLSDSKHFMIDVGPDFAKKTTPKTLKKRIDELGKAVKLIEQGLQGVVPAEN